MDVLAALLRLGFRWFDLRESAAELGVRLERSVSEALGVAFAMHESQTAMSKHGDERKTRYNGGDIYLQKHLT